MASLGSAIAMSVGCVYKGSTSHWYIHIFQLTKAAGKCFKQMDSMSLFLTHRLHSPIGYTSVELWTTAAFWSLIGDKALMC